MLEINDRVEAIENIEYLDPDSSEPRVVSKGTRGLVLKVADKPNLNFLAYAVQFEKTEKPVVLIQEPEKLNTVSKVVRV